MRSSGILMHISSLPSPYGIGTMGSAAYEFVDFLHKARQGHWQILPLCPTSYGDSPYQSFSSAAGNPYFIDLDILIGEGLLTKEECGGSWGENQNYVDYALIYSRRYQVLRLAFSRFSPDSAEYSSFCHENESWLYDYSMFMALKDNFGGISWHQWPEDIRHRTPDALSYYSDLLKENIDFYSFLQFKFFEQWFRLKGYANSKGIKIIGDIPIYVADDSVDVWVGTRLFDLTEELTPRVVAGVPPDGFSMDGQLWGNPVYNWKQMKAEGYKWWIDRIGLASKVYDIVRIDHFRGFDSFYAVEYGHTTARIGEWLEGPGYDLFDNVKRSLGDVAIIAEDLGYLTDSVKAMLAACGYPGMKIFEFGFYGCNPDSFDLPHNYGRHCVVYPGTHDNQTIVSWFEGLSEKEKQFCLDYLGCRNTEELVYSMLRITHRSVADLCIIQLQDYLKLDDSARMNRPSTLGGNWQWRVSPHMITDALASDIALLSHLYGRENNC